MKTIALGRMEGKTTLCIEYMRQNPKVHMLVWGGRLARSIKRQHHGLSGRVHSIRCNMRKLNKKHDIEAFIIDGLDDCLSILTGKEVRLVTFTTDTYEIPKR